MDKLLLDILRLWADNGGMNRENSGNQLTTKVVEAAYRKLPARQKRSILGNAIVLEGRTGLSRLNSMAVLAAIGAYLVADDRAAPEG